MSRKTLLIVGMNFLLLLGWTAFCRLMVAHNESGADQLSFTIPMAFGIFLLLLLNLGGVIWANQAGEEDFRQSFGFGLLAVLLIGFGLCGGAQP